MKRTLAFLTALILALVPTLGLAEIDQRASDLLHAMQKQVRELENVTVEGTEVYTYTVGDATQTAAYEYSMVFFHNPMIIHSTFRLSGSSDPEAVMETYILQQGDEVVIYSSNESAEMTKSFVKEIESHELVPETMGEMDGWTYAIDYMVSAQVAGEEEITVKGMVNDCIRVDIMVSAADMADELVYNIGLANPTLDDTWVKELETALANVEMPYSYWINKETNMLVQYSFDNVPLTDVINHLIPDELDMGYTVTDVQSVYHVVGINDAQEIMVPAKYITYNKN